MRRQLILGSSSQPRQRQLSRLKMPFEIGIPDVDETPLENETPTELVLRLAEVKARKVAEKFTDALIIGADQVGVLDGEIICKPINYENAIQQLQKVSGKKIEFIVGLCLLDSKDQSIQISLETFSVTFRELTKPMIECYLQNEDALNCAGSFKAEGLGIALIKECHDTDFSALIGLPLIRLIDMLEKVGMGPLSNNYMGI
jgi:septum formation protein